MKLSLVLFISATFSCIHASKTFVRPSVPVSPLPARAPSVRIVNGKDAKLGEFPFQVSLRFNNSNSHTCGGSIISSRHVMTAGHCVYNGDLYVVVGTVKLLSGGDRYEVAKVTRHEHYGNRWNHWRNDISILTLSTDIQFNDNVQPAALPTVDIFGEELSTISGWGRIAPNGPLPNNLQKLENWPVVDLAKCRKVTNINLYDGHLCAGAVEGSGVCNGDSGGPLSRNGAVYGIASFVFVPCGSGYPDMWTRVAFYVDWIESVVARDGVQLTYA